MKDKPTVAPCQPVLADVSKERAEELEAGSGFSMPDSTVLGRTDSPASPAFEVHNERRTFLLVRPFIRVGQKKTGAPVVRSCPSADKTGLALFSGLSALHCVATARQELFSCSGDETGRFFSGGWVAPIRHGETGLPDSFSGMFRSHPVGPIRHPIPGRTVEACMTESPLLKMDGQSGSLDDSQGTGECQGLVKGLRCSCQAHCGTSLYLPTNAFIRDGAFRASTMSVLYTQDNTRCGSGSHLP